MKIVEEERNTVEKAESLLLKFLGKTPELRLLDFLLENTLFDFTRKELVEELGMSKSTLYQILPKLLEMEVIKISRNIGKAPLYQINRDSPLVKELWRLEKMLIAMDTIINDPVFRSKNKSFELSKKFHEASKKKILYA